MNTDIKTDNYRGVVCRLCTQPIPVPRIVISMEEDAKREEAVTGLFQGERVFTLRCRSCEGEYPYRSKDVVNFEGSPKPRRSSREAELLRPAGRLSRAANA